jgi:hypothetical protein
VIGFRLVQTQATLDRQARAIALVTTSELAPLRLTPASADVAPPNAHANYRGREGVNVAVLSTEFLPTPPSGKTYQAWVRHGATWTSLGTFTTNADGTAQLVAEDPALATPPDAVEITLEPSAGGQSPTGEIVLTWPNG